MFSICPGREEIRQPELVELVELVGTVKPYAMSGTMPQYLPYVAQWLKKET